MTTTELRPPRGTALLCQGQSPEEVEQWLHRAADAGFEEVQVSFLWAPYRAGEFRHIAEVLRSRGLRCRVCGVYNDLLRPDVPGCFRTSMHELQTAIPLVGGLGASAVVAWAGSHSSDLLAADPRNHTPESRAELRTTVETLSPLLREHGVRLLLEPWHTHVLGDEQATADFCASFPGLVGAVIDVPNFIRPDEWGHRDERVSEIASTLAPHAGIVHLKDMTLDDGGNLGLPAFGKGGIDPVHHVRALSSLHGRVPIAVEHILSPDDIPEVVSNLHHSFAAAGLI